MAYHPWITITDPGRGTRAVPPAGHVAGVIARTDRERGVHAAPAGVPLRDATGLVARLSSRDTEALAARRINAIVTRGVPLVWGARTAAVDPEWKYVNVRRLLIVLERSIGEATRWAVFEPNDEPLWARVRGQVEEFLFARWRDGALAGTTPGDAFFVRCDRSTMTQDDLEKGRLVCLVGVAPVRPAEFVIFRVGQWTAPAALAAFPFLVAIDDVASAGFTEVTGLPAEGGTAGEAGLRLTQGLTSGPGLAGWFAAARQGDAVPRSRLGRAARRGRPSRLRLAPAPDAPVRPPGRRGTRGRRRRGQRDGADRPALAVLPTDVVNAADRRPVPQRAVEPAPIVGPDPAGEGPRPGGR